MNIQYDSDARSAIAFKSGGGCLMLFGLPFFLAGLAMLFAAATGKFSNPNENWIGYLMGGIFAAVGSGIMFGRYEFVIDPLQQRWWKKWSWLGLGKRKEGMLNDFAKVSVTREVRSNGKNSQTVYPVRLLRKDGGKALDVVTKGKFEDSRSEGERVAKALKIPLFESTGKTSLETNAEDLDLSFRDKVDQGKFDIVEVPQPLQPGKAVIDHQHGFLRANMKAGNLIEIMVGVLLMAFMPVPFVAVFFVGGQKEFSGGGPEVAFFTIFALFLAIPLLLGLFMVLKGLLAKESIEITMERVKVTRRFGPVMKVKEMAAVEIEDVWIRARQRHRQEIFLRGDNESLAFGGGLKKEERLYLLCLTQKVLAGKG